MSTSAGAIPRFAATSAFASCVKDLSVWLTAAVCSTESLTNLLSLLVRFAITPERSSEFPVPFCGISAANSASFITGSIFSAGLKSGLGSGLGSGEGPTGGSGVGSGFGSGLGAGVGLGSSGFGLSVGSGFGPGCVGFGPGSSVAVLLVGFGSGFSVGGGEGLGFSGSIVGFGDGSGLGWFAAALAAA